MCTHETPRPLASDAYLTTNRKPSVMFQINIRKPRCFRSKPMWAIWALRKSFLPGCLEYIQGPSAKVTYRAVLGQLSLVWWQTFIFSYICLFTNINFFLLKKTKIFALALRFIFVWHLTNTKMCVDIFMHCFVCRHQTPGLDLCVDTRPSLCLKLVSR